MIRVIIHESFQRRNEGITVDFEDDILSKRLKFKVKNGNDLSDLIRTIFDSQDRMQNIKVEVKQVNKSYKLVGIWQ